MMEVNRDMRLRNQARLRELVRARARELTVISAHDPVEFERAAASQAAAPMNPGDASLVPRSAGSGSPRATEKSGS
jgi:hypothetical protein